MAENPNFISEDQAQQMESAGFWAPLEQPPVSPTAKVPPPQTNINNYGGVPLPQNLGLQPDLTKTIYPPSTAPIRLMPIVQTAATNAASKSVATTVVQKAISELNIPQPTAQVTDGLIHGETPWESDPSFIFLRDDFASVTTMVTSGNIVSELSWAVIDNITNQNPNNTFPCLGSLNWTNSSTSSGVGFAVLSNGAISTTSGTQQNFAWPLYDYPSWKMIWVFKLSRMFPSSDAAWSWTKVSFYLGLANWNSSGSLASTVCPRPMHFCGLRYDTDTTSPSIGDTQFMFETVTNIVPSSTATRSALNVQGNTVATGISANKEHTYRFEMLCTSPGQIQMSLIDQESGISFTSTLSVPLASIALGSSTTWALSADTNYGTLNMNNVSNSLIAAPYGPGSKVSVTGSTNTSVNGNQVSIGGSSGSAGNSYVSFYNTTPFSSGGTFGSATISGYPAAMPFFGFGNDSEASPTASSKATKLDFFSFIWNPGVGGGTGTPNPLKARYF